jgi:hypothetical protein
MARPCERPLTQASPKVRKSLDKGSRVPNGKLFQNGVSPKVRKSQDVLARFAREVGGPQAEAAGLFWFTHETQYRDQLERVLGPVWQKARNDTLRPLLRS